MNRASIPLRRLCKLGFAPLRGVLPLPARIWVLRRWGRYPPLNYSFLARELLDDLARTDPAGFHRLLWSHHTGGLAYGKTYEISQRFGESNLRPSRRQLLAEVSRRLRDRGIIPERDVGSVFDVGCSLGYVLRYAEEHLFPSATCFRGIDVDQHAIDTGSAYLRSLGSKIELRCADIANLKEAMGNRKYDVVLCCGVLMYLDQPTAGFAVRTMLEHTRLLLGLLSHADMAADNVQLAHSIVRPGDLRFVHNVDAMVEAAGGKVVARRWTGAEPHSYTHTPPLFTLAERA